MPVNSSESYVVVTIDDVDIENRLAYVFDKTGGTFIASFRSSAAGILYIPAQGEHWTAIRIGYGWSLDKRLDTPTEHSEVVSSMSPGDVRVGTGGTTMLSTDNLLINSDPLGVAAVDAFDTDGIEDGFLLEYAPVSIASVQVYLAGLLVDPRTYSVVDNAVLFTSPPAAGVLVVYYQANPGTLDGVDGINEPYPDSPEAYPEEMFPD